MDKKLIELIEWLRSYTPQERLEMLLEAARTVGLPELEAAIENYWKEDVRPFRDTDRRRYDT